MADEVSKTVTLPSGRVAAVRRGKGRDLMKAQRAVEGQTDPQALIFALIAALATVDGQPLVYEDVLDMELGDVMALQAEVIGGNFRAPAGS